MWPLLRAAIPYEQLSPTALSWYLSSRVSCIAEARFKIGTRALIAAHFSACAICSAHLNSNDSNNTGGGRMIRISFFTGTFLLIMGMVQLSSDEVHAASGDQPIPPEYFGLHIARIVQTQPWYPYGDKNTPWPSIKFGS